MNSVQIQRNRWQAKRRYYATQLISPFVRFARMQTVGGILLLVFSAIAVMCANIPALSWVHKFWETDLSMTFNFNANFLPLRTVGEWVNDALMAIFFFTVGLEIKREMVAGELSSIRNALLPIFAAAGGMAAPALIYFGINSCMEGGATNGFGIPTATDIAFTIGVLSLLGKRVPIALKVFLTALAIVDDLGAILVLAIFYPTHALHFDFLLGAVGILAILVVLNSLRINRTYPYIFLGLILWFLTLRSGIHATVAGVALAMTIPSSIKINQIRFYVRSKYMVERFREAYNHNPSMPLLKSEMEQQQINNLANEIRKVTPLILRLEHSLQPWITFCIMPIFALANAGVVVSAESFKLLTHPVALGIFFGLLFGKPIGITLLSWLTIKLKLAAMPNKTRWIEMIGAGMLAGIGFTMAIFVDTIAFNTAEVAHLQNVGKLAILMTSTCAAIFGLIYMKLVTKKVLV